MQRTAYRQASKQAALTGEAPQVKVPWVKLGQESMNADDDDEEEQQQAVQAQSQSSTGGTLFGSGLGADPAGMPDASHESVSSYEDITETLRLGSFIGASGAALVPSADACPESRLGDSHAAKQLSRLSSLSKLVEVQSPLHTYQWSRHAQLCLAYLVLDCTQGKCSGQTLLSVAAIVVSRVLLC